MEVILLHILKPLCSLSVSSTHCFLKEVSSVFQISIYILLFKLYSFQLCHTLSQTRTKHRICYMGCVQCATWVQWSLATMHLYTSVIPSRYIASVSQFHQLLSPCKCDPMLKELLFLSELKM